MTATPFHDLSDFLAIPRVAGLRLSPDGTWLAASVQTLSADRKKYVTSIWRIDVAGGPARRLTRSAEGEGSPRFLPDGSLLFTSKRPDAESGGKEGESNGAALWLLPPGGGEGREIASLPGGVGSVETAADEGATIIVSSPVLTAAGTDNSKTNGGSGADGSGAGGSSAGGASANGSGADVAGADGAGEAGPGGTAADDERLRKARKDAGVTAILHETVPVRYWDHDLGPDDLRLFAVTTPSEEGTEKADVRDLTPDAGRALLNQSFAVSPDGGLVATGWWQWQDGVQSHSELVLIDVATGKRTTLLSDPDFDYDSPRFSPDGRAIVAARSTHHTPEKAHDVTLVCVPVAGNGDAAATDLVAGLDRWPAGAEWGTRDRSVYFTADDGGRHPVFKASANGAATVRLTGDHGYYSDLNVASDGTIFALRMAIDEPFTPVRVDPETGKFERLPAPGQRPGLPGTLTEITAEADDGHPIRAWLVLPETAADRKAPLLLWVHGGPMMSWNNWSWRWNPWLMAARGYAVLLPDPALSTGYGQDFVQRGYHSWGERPFRDITAITDAAIARPDIDETRTAMMGGSYGGYMANWIAGHTDRFKAIVSHAGLWTLDQMFGTTDMPQFWRPQFGDPVTSPDMYEANSPHRHIDHVTTPMLVIHGAKDYRVPFGEALRLWWDLKRNGNEAKFLYFPDENHWIMSPGNVQIWYETTFAFLGQHVLGEPWQRPELL
ncbi:MAG TPA: S9 family peptidase [Trebonia sp.]|nr:S9 family peptidase [Trebonia sp.]